MSLTRQRFTSVADWIGVAIAASLPWSTSATGILAALWLFALVPSLELPSLRRVLFSPAGALPVLLVLLGIAGMLWADVPWAERTNGLNSLLKLLFIPLLLCHFERSERGHYVLFAFLISCVLLLITSWIIFKWPELPLGRGKRIGIPVKDTISQSAMFSTAFFFIGLLVRRYWIAHRHYVSVALVGLMLVFLANIFFIATSRTSLVVIPALLIVFGFRLFSWKGAAALVASFLILGAVAWPAASYLQLRVETLIQEITSHQPQNTATSAGERLEFWKKSIDSIHTSPIFGHGTGSIPDQFRRAAAGRTGMAGEASVNPHNQIFAIGIQFGFIGIALLLSMWIAHLGLFRSASFPALAGLVIVIQNIIGSMFNSHLSDFTHSWLYVIGVGVAGGIAAGRWSEQTTKQAARAANPATDHVGVHRF